LSTNANTADAAPHLETPGQAAAENPRAEWFGSTALLDRDVVAAWREELTGLAERLEEPGPVGPCGVARARVLACDGMGPLYNPASERYMGEAISWIAEGLDMSQPVAGQGAVRASNV
jgi:hypothetical protein